MKASAQGVKDGRRPGTHKGIAKFLKKIYSDKKQSPKLGGQNLQGVNNIKDFIFKPLVFVTIIDNKQAYNIPMCNMGIITDTDTGYPIEEENSRK